MEASKKEEKIKYRFSRLDIIIFPRSFMTFCFQAISNRPSTTSNEKFVYQHHEDKAPHGKASILPWSETTYSFASLRNSSAPDSTFYNFDPSHFTSTEPNVYIHKKCDLLEVSV